MQVNEALKRAIAHDGRKQYAIALKAGISEGRFTRIITGRCDPTDDEAKAIARILRCKVQDLFAGVAA